MIGGIVIEVKSLADGKQQVWCVDPRSGDEGAICLQPGNDIAPQDKLWWQGNCAYWTPKDGPVVEKKIRCVGFSFDPRKEPSHD